MRLEETDDSLLDICAELLLVLSVMSDTESIGIGCVIRSASDRADIQAKINDSNNLKENERDILTS